MLKLLLAILPLIAGATNEKFNLKLTADNIPEIVKELTVEEKCELIVGGRAEMFKPKAYKKVKAPGATSAAPARPAGSRALIL